MSGEAFRKYAADLAKVAGRLDSMRDSRLLRVGKGAAATARSVAPTDTGRLRAGINVVKRPDGSVAVEADLSTHDDYYAHFQEYGTSDMAPNPFMGPAVDKWGPELVREVEGIADDVAKELS